MSWTVCRWIWRLEAPLFVGMPPAGMLNRCRLYVPPRAMHGAVTAELARLKADEKSSFPDYGKFGHEVGIKCRFTCLYPAEKVGDDYLVWLPKFQENEGLVWCRCQGDDSSEPERKFRAQLLDARPGTAITPETDAASEGTLRETECINPWWRKQYEDQAEPSPVFLLGYVFLHENSFRQRLQEISTLFVGGDTRYGLGKLRRVQWDDQSAGSVFGARLELDGEDPEIISVFVWGHAPVEQAPAHGMRGMMEVVGGWEITALGKTRLAWVPGSHCADNEEAAWAIDNYGYWIYQY